MAPHRPPDPETGPGDPIAPGHDPSGSAPATAFDRAGAELDRRVDELTDDVLWPAATEVDQADRLPSGHLDALADAGLYAMVVPAELGGLGLAPWRVRGILRRLGSGCGATAFAFAQHHGTIGAVAASPNRDLRDRWLPQLTTRTLAGIAYAHVRRPGPPILRATPAGPTRSDGGGGGWVLDGQGPWVTSWGMAEVIGVAARSEDGRLVWALVPAVEGPTLRVVRRFDLAVFGATATVAIEFDRHRIEPDDVIDVFDFDRWAERDRQLAARPNPLCLGVGDRAIELLTGIDADAAAALRPGWERLVAAAEAQARSVDDGRADLGAVADTRAEAVVATQRLATALLAAVGGRAMERAHPAQRLHREAGFYVVQAQNDVGRAAMLDRLATAPAAPGGLR